MPEHKLELLGHIKTTSGTMFLIDFGFLDFWCDDGPPTFPEWIAPSQDVLEQANQAVDLKITGPDAVKAGDLFNRNWHPEYIYDIPRNGVKKIKRLFNKLIKEQMLNASIEVLSDRITHKKRVELALEYGNGIGEVSFYSIWGIVVGNLPVAKKFSVYGERMVDNKWKDHWKQIIIDIQPETKAKITKNIGYIPVDEANILISDITSLKELSKHEPLDGLADLVFWGRDGFALAEKLSAAQIDGNSFGWVNLPIKEAVYKGEHLHQTRENGEFKFAFDFRPHSHKHKIYEQIRSSKTESGILDLEGNTVCCFMTSWGDGTFPVIGEFDTNNNLVRIRIDLGNEKTIENMEYLIKGYE